MKWLFLLLPACGIQVVSTPRDMCEPPKFTESACYDPGGGVTRCEEADGTYWDKQPTGNQVHWAWCPYQERTTVTLCEVP